MRVGIFGGTFDPIHKGHINAAIEFYDRIQLDKMYVIPTGEPPHKSGVVASAKARLEMAEVAFEKYVQNGYNIEISDIETAQQGKSYTIFTAEKIAKRNKCDKIFVYTGTDMFCSIEKWFRFEDLFKLCIFTAAPRDEGDVDRLRDFSKRYALLYDAQSVVMDFAPVEMSSTEIRIALSMLADEEKSKDAFNILTEKYLTEDVTRYIIENRLYFGNESDMEIAELLKEPPITEQALARIEAEALEGISDTRAEHILSVAKEALDMAQLVFSPLAIPDDYKRDVKAAALLHDLTKELTTDQQLMLCEDKGILLSVDDFCTPPVLHAITGSFVARQRFSVNDRIANAIKRHTTGDGNMSVFDKIIFLADYTEPTRRHKSCRELHDRFFSPSQSLTTKREAMVHIDDCVRICCESTIAYLKKTNRRIHKSTVDALKAVSKQEPAKERGISE